MRLNAQMPTLPVWPYIEADSERNELVVHGRHVSYGRYVAARYLLWIAALVYFYYVGKEAIEERKIFPGLVEAVIVHFAPYIILINLLPIPKWICWLLFRTHTKVHFTPEFITVRGMQFPATSDVDIRFGAFQTVLQDRDVQREQNHRQARYLLRFKRIDMVYGLRVVDIATIDNEERAEQFAVALQVAYAMSRPQQMRRIHPLSE